MKKAKKQIVVEFNDDEEYFNKYLNAKEGGFDGERMSLTFQARVDKNKAKHVGYSDDCGNYLGVHVSEDDKKVYMMCEPKDARKIVIFNFGIFVTE